MIVDTSAIVALVSKEPGWQQIDAELRRSERTRISAATLVELHAVLDRRLAPEQRRMVDFLLDEYGVAVEPLTAEHARVAREAYRDFGRGSGHAAHLNLGDVFSYALAVASGEPLLFVGDDFTRTDVVPALPRT